MLNNARNLIKKFALISICLSIVIIYSSGTALARDSKFTRNGSGPMY